MESVLSVATVIAGTVSLVLLFALFVPRFRSPRYRLIQAVWFAIAATLALHAGAEYLARDSDWTTTGAIATFFGIGFLMIARNSSNSLRR
jgi:hypothetical protein